MQEPPKVDVLETLVKRGSMHWGASDNDFHSFMAFVAGADAATSSSDQEIKEQLANILPPHFGDFVFEEFGAPESSPMGWTSVIEVHTKDGREVLDLFYELRKKHDQSRWAQVKVKDS